MRRVAGDYDVAVAAAAKYADADTGRALVQDTAWPGYEEVPQWIVDGYETLLDEVDESLGAAPDLVAVPVGVGSLAQAVATHYRRPGTGGCRILSVAPDTAAGILASLQAGEPTSVPTADTIMAGLNCGTVSAAAWPVLRRGLDAAISVHDDPARTAVTDLATEGVSARPSAGMAPPPAPASRDRLRRDRDRGLSRRHPRRPRLRRGARPGRDRARRVDAPRRRHTQHRAARGYGRLADHRDARSGPRLAQPGRNACVRPRRAPGDGARCCGPAGGRGRFRGHGSVRAAAGRGTEQGAPRR